ncbi:MAG: hypothetical protein QG567_1724 [Campylobacterota bacterium]|nr:hypothetical protein [Campylobacterota bacterium]
MSKTEQPTTLMKQTLQEFGMTYKEFAEFSKIPQGTLEGWNQKLPHLGEVTLNKFLECKRLKDKLRDFDALMSIIGKYSKPLN